MWRKHPYVFWFVVILCWIVIIDSRWYRDTKEARKEGPNIDNNIILWWEKFLSPDFFVKSISRKNFEKMILCPGQLGRQTHRLRTAKMYFWSKMGKKYIQIHKGDGGREPKINPRKIEFKVFFSSFSPQFYFIYGIWPKN